AFKSLWVGGGAGTVAVATPVVAKYNAGGEEVNAIVVTGSRIHRPDFENNSPTVTVDETLFERSSSSAIEVNLNKLPQFTPAQTPQARSEERRVGKEGRARG